MKSIFDKPVTQLMRENLEKYEFTPVVPESSGIPEELSEEEAEALVREIKMRNR